MSNYGLQVKKALLETILGPFVDETPPAALVELGIDRAQTSVTDSGSVRVRIWGRGNPLPATFSIRIVEH